MDRNAVEWGHYNEAGAEGRALWDQFALDRETRNGLCNLPLLHINMT